MSFAGSTGPPRAPQQELRLRDGQREAEPTALGNGVGSLFFTAPLHIHPGLPCGNVTTSAMPLARPQVSVAVSVAISALRRLLDGELPRRRGQRSMPCIPGQVAAGEVVAAGVGAVEVQHLLVAESLVEELAQRVRAGAIDHLAPGLLLDQRRDAAAAEVERDAVKWRVERGCHGQLAVRARSAARADRPDRSCSRWPARPRHKGTRRAERESRPVPGTRPGQGVVHDHARAGGRHGPGQQVEAAAKLAVDDLGLLAGVGAFVVERLLVFLVSASRRRPSTPRRRGCGACRCSTNRRWAQKARRCARCRAGSARRPRPARCQVAGGQAPGAELGVERLDRRLQGADRVGQPSIRSASRASRGSTCRACRRGPPATRASRPAPPGRNRRACRNERGRPACSSAAIAPQILHVGQRGRPLVVAGHDHGEVVLAGPVCAADVRPEP